MPKTKEQNAPVTLTDQAIAAHLGISVEAYRRISAPENIVKAEKKVKDSRKDTVRAHFTMDAVIENLQPAVETVKRVLSEQMDTCPDDASDYGTGVSYLVEVYSPFELTDGERTYTVKAQRASFVGNRKTVKNDSADG